MPDDAASFVHTGAAAPLPLCDGGRADTAAELFRGAGADDFSGAALA